VASQQNLVVSVITVVRNDVHRIEHTIRSVIGQRYRQVEHVIVDGASTDGTRDVIRSYSCEIASWTSEPDRGIAHAMNKGARIATGDLMLFLNSGDSFVDDRALASAVALVPADLDVRRAILYGDARYRHASGVSILHTDHETLDEGNTICHQSVLIGADVQRANPYDERLSIFMDYDLWLRCLGTYPFIKLPLLIGDFSSGGVSGADDSGVRLTVERAVVQLINGQMRPDGRALAGVVSEVVASAAKRRVRQLVGARAFLRLKRLVGRNTPSVWAPPSRDGQGD
jgi:glycosyltransferase involved in cell wall biosynthesis